MGETTALPAPTPFAGVYARLGTVRYKIASVDVYVNQWTINAAVTVPRLPDADTFTMLRRLFDANVNWWDIFANGREQPEEDDNGQYG